MKGTQEKGITLIALVITIIVLLILAGVSITLALDPNNGLFTRAQQASDETRVGSIKEALNTAGVERTMESLLKGNVKTTEEIIEDLKSKGLVVDEEISTNAEGKKIITIGSTIIDVAKEIGGANEEDTGITASDIESDASYIGKYVNYGGQETYKGVKWRIFNAENGQIQLIADNYIHSDVMPTAKNIRRGTSEDSSMKSDFCVNSSDNRITLLNYINTASNWSDFVAVTGATVTGGPTLEQFKNSYNRTHGASSKATVKEIFIAKSSAMADGLEGYYVGKSANPNSYMIQGLNTTEMENLYVIDDYTNAYAYRLSSPSASTAYYVMRVYCYGYVDYDSYDVGHVGLRPLVSLPSGITLVEQENGTYNVQ